MGILDSLISLAVIVGAGYVTITYVIPKIQGGEFGLPGASASGGGRRRRDSASAIMGDLASTADIPKKKREKKPYDPSKGMAGKGGGARGGGAKGGGAKGGGAKGGGKTKGGKEEEKKKKVKKELIYAYLDGEF